MNNNLNMSKYIFISHTTRSGKVVNLNYLKDKCPECGELKQKPSPYCRKCYLTKHLSKNKVTMTIIQNLKDNKLSQTEIARKHKVTSQWVSYVKKRYEKEK